MTSDLGGNSGCRAGIVGMRNCNWGNLTEELRLQLMDSEGKFRAILRINQVVFLLGKGLSHRRSCRRLDIRQPEKTLKEAGIENENVEDRDEEDKSNEILGSRCLWGSLW